MNNQDASVMAPEQVFSGETDSLSCPFYGEATEICGASFSSLVISGAKKAVFCETEDYDRCPLFLSKALRRGTRDTALLLK
ncbi:MAG TPA: hypothetical protein VLD40_01615 [Dissulfurispiraceae bacterium]|nr:hypothetical protein [Dissulfurispiraceae bacterium]